MLSKPKFLLASALLLSCLQAHAASVTVRTPDTHGAFVPSASLRFGSGPAEVKIETTTGVPDASPLNCYLIIATEGAPPATVAESVTSPLTPEVRLYDPIAPAPVTFEISSCTQITGEPSEAFSLAQLEVYPSDTPAVNGACGSAAGVPTEAMPIGTNLCAAGSTSVSDSSGVDGNFDWTCGGKYGGTDTQCSAPRSEPTTSPIYNATFTGTRSPNGSGVRDALSWNFPNAVGTCTASGNWSGSLSKSGSKFVSYTSPTPGSKTYTLTCSNANGTASKSVTVQ